MEVGIVGAGPAGAAAAYALRDAADVTLFEKSRAYGRTATRRRDGCRYDYGANYVKSDDPVVNDLLTGALPTDDLVDVTAPVWTFDRDGTISEGRDDDAHKWTYTDGITGLVKRLLDAAGARDAVEYGTRVGSLARTDDRWHVRAEDGGSLGTYDAVVLTPPAPQTAAILDATVEDALGRDAVDRDATDRGGGAADALAELREAVATVPFRGIVSVVAHYDFRVERPWYALVNTDREHAVGWLSREECKPGHVPDGESLLVVQMAPDWSAERIDGDDDGSGSVERDAVEHVAALLDDARFAAPDWTDRQDWRYALPDDGLEGDAAARAEHHGLFLAGDWVAGEGRVHRALRSGLETGGRVAER